jgi:hypothetical protein
MLSSMLINKISKKIFLVRMPLNQKHVQLILFCLLAYSKTFARHEKIMSLIVTKCHYFRHNVKKMKIDIKVDSKVGNFFCSFFMITNLKSSFCFVFDSQASILA